MASHIIEVRQVSTLGRTDDTVRVSYTYETGTAVPLIEYTDAATDADLGRMLRGAVSPVAVKW